ncbi:activator of mitotic machinery Cdc14 phosphatase activation C-term-domain-containing protein [Sporodiniella umbellata]|nr:activator of mitotic machinery Cdc14 phosphatase activation C-term-domain-containing protein [Sporodiniella umbellata]
MNDILTTHSFTEQQIANDQDIYANLILSNLLDNNELIKEHKDQETPIELTEDLIWVPAEKHPKLAPIEFAKFLKIQGTNLPVKRAASLQRKKSSLSETYTAEDLTDEEARTPSQKRKTDDEARPTTAKQLLLRRSAFSARGRSRRCQPTVRRSTSERKRERETWDRSEGVRLYDQPVNMCEWIDLGNVSLGSESSQQGILSRVHDAESQLRSPIRPQAEEPTGRRPGMKRPPAVVISTRREPGSALGRKPSWLMGIFGTKQGSSGPFQANPLSSLAVLFSRRLNTDSGTAANSKKMKLSRLEPPPLLASYTSTAFYHHFNRLPIHVERALYRLSHIKLADPKRQLRQQVMISNLMFWYLSLQQTPLIEPSSPMQQPPLPKKQSKMSRLIHAAKRRTQPNHNHHNHHSSSNHSEDDDLLPLSHYKRFS